MFSIIIGFISSVFILIKMFAKSLINSKSNLECLEEKIQNILQYFENREKEEN